MWQRATIGARDFSAVIFHLRLRPNAGGWVYHFTFKHRWNYYTDYTGRLGRYGGGVVVDDLLFFIPLYQHEVLFCGISAPSSCAQTQIMVDLGTFTLPWKGVRLDPRAILNATCWQKGCCSSKHEETGYEPVTLLPPISACRVTKVRASLLRSPAGFRKLVALPRCSPGLLIILMTLWCSR